jgi:hypothetical protein
MMAHEALCMDIRSVSSMVAAANSAARMGDMLVAEEALVDAYNRLSQILKDMEAREHHPFSTRDLKPSVSLWRHGGS